MTYNTWSIVLVSFPFTDRNQTKKRPALVINQPEYQQKTGYVILLMITSAKNSSWQSDLTIADLKQAGLPSPSVIRFKMFTLDERFILKEIGSLCNQDLDKVKEELINTIVLK